VRIDSPIGRRSFLRMGAGLAVLSQLRLGVAAPAVAAPAVALRVLSAGDAATLAAIAERMTFTGDPEMPRFSQTDGLRTIDTALLQVPGDVAAQLHWALLLFDYGPLLFLLRLSRFTGLEAEAQDHYLAAWQHSRFGLLRLAFDAFKNLSFLGYYAQDATWKGIHYAGPWVPRPRRAVG
jgi:hypothetical protein